jgi:hypothetical protein
VLLAVFIFLVRSIQVMPGPPTAARVAVASLS